MTTNICWTIASEKFVLAVLNSKMPAAPIRIWLLSMHCQMEIAFLWLVSLYIFFWIKMYFSKASHCDLCQEITWLHHLLISEWINYVQKSEWYFWTTLHCANNLLTKGGQNLYFLNLYLTSTESWEHQVFYLWRPLYLLDERETSFYYFCWLQP